MIGLKTWAERDRVIVVGSGIAGLATALCLAPLPVLLVTQGAFGQSGSTWRAQGGIACALGPDDNARNHADDTVAAGAGLCDRVVVDSVTAAAPDCIALLRQWGVPFDLDAGGAPALTLEAAHGHCRVLHAGGDKTGAALAGALTAKVRATASIEIVEQASVTELIVDNGHAQGAWVQAASAITAVPARAVVIATGGIGGLYASTTNPLGNWGAGLHLAARAGAELRDLEFVQFHPTAIDAPCPDGRLPLASEAIRGEGAVLVDDRGDAVMSGVPGGNLAPRDKVARAVHARLRAGRTVYLDARQALGARFARRFPEVTALCGAAGIDPVNEPIPVRPAAHYHMGGVVTDGSGATGVPGLWVVGEAASTGMHGANRLASNSLLEALAFARLAARDIQGRVVAKFANSPQRPDDQDRSRCGAGPATVAAMARLGTLMDIHVGVERDRSGLEAAIAAMTALRATSPLADGLDGMIEVAQMMARAALGRQETRGAHVRADFPAAAERPLHQIIRLADMSSGRLETSWTQQGCHDA